MPDRYGVVGPLWMRPLPVSGCAALLTSFPSTDAIESREQDQVTVASRPARTQIPRSVILPRLPPSHRTDFPLRGGFNPERFGAIGTQDGRRRTGPPPVIRQPTVAPLAQHRPVHIGSEPFEQHNAMHPPPAWPSWLVVRLHDRHEWRWARLGRTLTKLQLATKWARIRWSQTKPARRTGKHLRTSTRTGTGIRSRPTRTGRGTFAPHPTLGRGDWLCSRRERGNHCALLAAGIGPAGNRGTPRLQTGWVFQQ